MNRESAARIFPILFAIISILPLSAIAQITTEPVQIPRDATALMGIPDVRVDSSDTEDQRTLLTPEEAKKSMLLVSKVGDTYYWTSRENRQLEIRESGIFTYLYLPGLPGSYVKFVRAGDKILYMEHVTILLSTITYWGELEIVTGK